MKAMPPGYWNMTNQREPARKAIRHKVRDDNCSFFFSLTPVSQVGECVVSCWLCVHFEVHLSCSRAPFFLGGGVATVTVLDCLRQTRTLIRFPLLSLLVSHVSVASLTFILRLTLTAARCRCQSVIASLVGFGELCQCLNSPGQRGAP